MNQRLPTLDRLRVTATFAVIAIHVTAAYIFVSPFAYYVNQWVRFAVPLFIIMSGFLVYYADLNTGLLPVAAFYRKRLSKVLIPYILWTLVYSSLVFQASGAAIKLPLLIIWWGKHLLGGTAFYHLYFLLIILQLYVLYPWIRKKLEQRWVIWLVISLILTLTTQSILYLDMMNLITLPASYHGLYLVAFPGWLFYFVLGMCAAFKKNDWEIYLPRHMFRLVCLYLLSLGLLLTDSRVTSTYGASIRPSVVLYTVSSYFLFYGLALRLKHPVSFMVEWLAQQSFLIFLVHPLVLAGLIYPTRHGGLPPIWATPPGMLGLYLLTVAGTVAIAYLTSLTPLAPWVGGTTCKRPHAAK